MTQSLKIECLVTDLTLEGEVASFLVTKEQLTAGLSKKADLVDGKIKESNLPDFIANGFQTVNQKLSTLETSITDGIQSAKDYAEAYTNEKLIDKADLVDGKVPQTQLPSIEQYEGLSDALNGVLDQARRDMIERTDEIQRTKADIGEDGKVVRAQLPNYDKIPGLETVVTDLYDSKANVDDVETSFKESQEQLDAHSLLLKSMGSILPYNPSNTYAEGYVTLKDGSLQQLVSGKWIPFKLNAINLVDLSGETQQQVNYNGGSKWHYRDGGYQENERAVLDNGDIVKSMVNWNKNDPNVDMTGWVKTNSTSQIFDASGLTQQEINDLIGNPIMFGAKGDGVFDDTLAIQECADKFRYLDMRNGNWKTTGKITLRSGTVVDLRGSYLSANNANEPIFEFENAGDGLSILGGGGYVYGTADSFLKCTGKTYQPTAQTDYARRIRLDGLHVSGENIDKFLDFDKAVRQVFLTHVFAYTKNGMFCNGKCVEFEIYGSLIYGAKGTTDLTTYGIRYVSPGGGRWYNEGLHITDSTIDNFGTTFDIRDIYAMSITGGHIGAAIQSDGNNAPGALVAKFGQPTSTSCQDIKFANVNIYGNIEFAPVGGLDYHAKFTGCTSEMCNGANIFIKNNASSITVSNHTFHSSTNGVAVVCQSNNFNISVNDITCDQTFIGGVHVRSAIGDNVSVRGINYAGSGDAVYCERPILISDVPVATAGMANYKRKLVNVPQSTYAVSQTIATVSAGFAKGETGEIVVELSYSGATPTNQVLKINIPVGLVVPNGSGWSSEYVELKSASGTISARIPYFVTKSIASADIALTNFGGSALTLGYHGYFGFKRDW